MRNRLRNTPAQLHAIIAATIAPLLPFPRGYAHNRFGPFIQHRTIRLLVEVGALRKIQKFHGHDRNPVTARCADA